jgi:uroporphyrinogen-III synthase
MRKTILLLRAADDAARSAAELQKRGHRLVLSPVIEIVPLGLPLPEGPFDGVIATSAQAFKFMPREDAEQLRTLPLLCVGSRGALAALRLGFPQALIIAPDAKSLTPQIIAKLPPPAHFLYLAGEDRKPDLEDDLAAAQFQVTIHEMYSAEAAEKLTSQALSAIEDGAIDAILHYSRRSAEIFLSLAEEAQLDLSRPAHICL